MKEKTPPSEAADPIPAGGRVGGDPDHGRIQHPAAHRTVEGGCEGEHPAVGRHHAVAGRGEGHALGLHQGGEHRGAAEAKLPTVTQGMPGRHEMASNRFCVDVNVGIRWGTQLVVHTRRVPWAPAEPTARHRVGALQVLTADRSGGAGVARGQPGGPVPDPRRRPLHLPGEVGADPHAPRRRHTAHRREGDACGAVGHAADRGPVTSTSSPSRSRSPCSPWYVTCGPPAAPTATQAVGATQLTDRSEPEGVTGAQTRVASGSTTGPVPGEGQRRCDDCPAAPRSRPQVAMQNPVPTCTTPMWECCRWLCRGPSPPSSGPPATPRPGAGPNGAPCWPTATHHVAAGHVTAARPAVPLSGSGSRTQRAPCDRSISGSERAPPVAVGTSAVPTEMHSEDVGHETVRPAPRWRSPV